MSTLQIPLNTFLNQGLEFKTKCIGVSKAAYVKMLIARDVGVIDEAYWDNNIFDADRDNGGKGISGKEFCKMLKSEI